MAATTNIRTQLPTRIAPPVMSTAARLASSPPPATATTPAPSPLRAPTHAARRVTTALRGADGRLAVVCGA